MDSLLQTLMIAVVAIAILAVVVQWMAPSAPGVNPTVLPSVLASPSPSATANAVADCWKKFSQANASQNAALCESISCADVKAYCKSFVGGAVESCESAGSLKDDCYSKIAVELNISDACGRIADSDKKNYCLGVTTQNSSYCFALKGPFANFSRDLCLNRVAMVSRNYSLCSSIENENLRNACANAG